jgi:cell division septation protein DedD
VNGPALMAPPDPRPQPELLTGAALVALVPATDDLARAAGAAWTFARHVAATGRRVALVDCYVDGPWLHGVAGEPNGDGIVDVFEYGASLSRIARAQPEPSLFFVPAGTLSVDPVAMMANPRWARLAAGFRHEDATMLLFLPPESVGAVAAELDGLVALAPDGAEAGLAATPEIQAAVDRGVRLVATVTDAGGIEVVGESRPAAAQRGERTEEREDVSLGAPAADEESPSDVEPLPAPPLPPTPPPAPVLRPRWRPVSAPSPRGRWVVLGLVLLGAAGLATSSLVRLRPRSAPQGPRPAPAAASAPVPSTAALPSPAPSLRAPAPPPAAATADSLPFAVQISAWTRFGQALADGDRLAARGVPSMIAPIRIRQRLWYRVYAGPAATRGTADSLLKAVQAARLDASHKASVARVPLSFTLGSFPTVSAARSAARRLRSRGIATFLLRRRDGAVVLLAGAYASAGQADDLGHVLTSTGNAGPLGPRVGIRP